MSEGYLENPDPTPPTEKQTFAIVSEFEWNESRQRAALWLATGHSIKEAAEEAGVSTRTIHNWKKNLDFETEVDRLSLLYGGASKAYRARIGNMAIRQFIKENEDGTVELNLGDSTLLDWIKELRMMTDGERLNIAAIYSALADEARSVARSGPERNDPLDDTEPDSTE